MALLPPPLWHPATPTKLKLSSCKGYHLLMLRFFYIKKIASNSHETTNSLMPACLQGSSKGTFLKQFRIFNVWRQKNQSVFFYVRNWDGVELNCNTRGSWGWSYLLFSMAGGATRQVGRERERERESEQKRSRWRYGAFWSSVAGWKCDFSLLCEHF